MLTREVAGDVTVQTLPTGPENTTLTCMFIPALSLAAPPQLDAHTVPIGSDVNVPVASFGSQVLAFNPAQDGNFIIGTDRTSVMPGVVRNTGLSLVGKLRYAGFRCISLDGYWKGADLPFNHERIPADQAAPTCRCSRPARPGPAPAGPGREGVSETGRDEYSRPRCDSVFREHTRYLNL